MSDKRLLYTATPATATQVDWYVADVQSYGDYYVFGAMQTGRAGGSYRYGFNGKENDDEINNVKGSWQDYGMRMYDPRVGRFFSADPLMFFYPHLSTYQFSHNCPVTAVDVDGMEGQPANGSLPEGWFFSNGKLYDQNENEVKVKRQKHGQRKARKASTPPASTNQTGTSTPPSSTSQPSSPSDAPYVNNTLSPEENPAEPTPGYAGYERSAADEFGDGVYEAEHSILYGIADEGPMYLVNGMKNTFLALGDIFNDGIDYWSKPRTATESIIYLSNETNYSQTSRAIVHATPRGYGRFFGGMAFTAAAGGWVRGVAPLNAGRYFPEVASRSGITSPKFSLTEDVLYGTNETGKVTSRGNWRKATVQANWDNASAGSTGGKLCPSCGVEVFVRPFSGTPRDWHIDHITPWTKRRFLNGVTRSEVLNNYQMDTRLSCPKCNISKSNK